MRVKGFTELAKKNRKSGVHTAYNEHTEHTEKQFSNDQNLVQSESININDDDDDDTINKSIIQQRCVHLNKAINNFNFLKKVLKTQSIGECTSCLDLKRKGHDLQIKKSTNMWLCLSCGHQGCDRSSEFQHALKHYQTPRSQLHCIVLNIESFVLWCYDCDDEIKNYGKRVEEVISSVKKFCSHESNHLQNKNTINVIENSFNETSNSSSEQQVIVISNTNCVQQIVSKKQPVQENITNTNLTNTINNSINRVNGLNNLGNTCFFNAVLQNLAQTPNLENILQEAINSKNKDETIQNIVDYEYDSSGDTSENEDNKKDDSDIDKLTVNKTNIKKLMNNNLRIKNKIEQLTIHINDAGSMTYNLFSLIKEMNSVRSSYSLSPGSLFSLVCKKVPSFKGFQQQDSHELLRHLLDAVKAEEIKRRQQGILNAFNYNPKYIDESIKQKIKNFGRLINYTCIDSLFGGHLLSTILCEQCKTCSQNIEPFLDLSLPIVEDKTIYHSLNNRSSIIEENDKNDNLMSKNKLKKQKKLAKKKKNNRIKTSTKNLPDDDSENNKQTNLILSNNTVSEDEEENDDENTQTNDSNIDYIETTGNNDYLSSKTDEMITPISDSFYQNDNNNNNNFKLEAMQSLSKRSSLTITHEEDSCSLQSFLLKFTSPELLSGNNKFGCETCTRLSYRKLNTNANSIPKDFKTVYSSATKQYLLCELPAILTIHLKRFQQQGFRLEKVNKHVNFPLELDMTPYTSKMCINLNKNQNNKVIYSLYGLVEHSGRLNGGHYTAYVKVRQKQNLEKLLGKKKLTVLKPNSLLNNVNNTKETETNDNNDTDNLQNNNNNLSSAWYYVSDAHVSEVPESKVLKAQAYILFYERYMFN